jgi:signal transduction histidine kinase
MRSFEFETERRIDKLQEDQLAEAQRRETLRGDLLRRIVEAQEAERQRIARELHDETGQALTAIGLGLRGVSSSLRQDLDKSAHNLRKLEGLITHSLNELQHVIADLRPSHLDDLGLAATLRWYALDVRNRAPLEVNIVVIGEERPLPSEVKTALFRVTQEALTNTIKHADAQNAHVRLVYGGQNVSVRVEDDGCGFDLTQIDGSERSAWGIIGMEERASLLGGSFTITSNPGQGTQVEIVIPYEQQLEDSVDEDSSIVG